MFISFSAGYEEAVKKLIIERCVDWWIPVSLSFVAQADCSVKVSLAASNHDVKVRADCSVKVSLATSNHDVKVRGRADCSVNVSLAASNHDVKVRG